MLLFLSKILILIVIHLAFINNACLLPLIAFNLISFNLTAFNNLTAFILTSQQHPSSQIHFPVQDKFY